MSLTSFRFLLFLLAVIAAYYALPKKTQPYCLLAASLAFYFIVAEPWTFLYVLASIVTIYGAAIGIFRIREGGKSHADARAKAVYILALFLNFGILAVLKYTNFVIYNIQHVMRVFHISGQVNTVSWPAALGISYYTLQMVSYLTDVYWNIRKPQRNIFKVALFACFFPQMISGPISRHSQLGEQFDKEHPFSLEQVERGAQRILWGFFKKLVISEKMAVIVNAIYSDPAGHDGLFIWTAMLLYPLQIYTDFSGCMDIVNGAAECFGIQLPENFREPFFSRTIQEFWQRWHITLGLWLKDYVMYPILKSRAWDSMGSRLKKKFGKKAGKRIPLYLAMLILWFCNGIWHGNSWKYIIGVGLWFWFAIVAGQILEPVFLRLSKALRIPTESAGWRVFQSFRTYVTYGIGALFFCASDLRNGFFLIRCGLKTFHPSIYVDGSFFKLGLDLPDMVVALAGLSVVWFVSAHGGILAVREKLEARKPLARGTVYLAMFLATIVFGSYGAGYNAGSFIYAMF